MTITDLQNQIVQFITQSPLPWWEWDILNNKVTASRHKVEMLGYNHADFADKGYQAYTALVHPEDYERTMAAMHDLLEGRTSIYQVDYRIKDVNGSFHWYMDRGAIIRRMPDKSPALLRGIVIDLGEHITPNAPENELVSLLRTAMSPNTGKKKVLSVCSSCKRIRSGNEWLEVSAELTTFIAMQKSHGICPDCLRTLYPEYAADVLEELEELNLA